MSSKIKENLLFYLASTREKSRTIGINHDLNIKNDFLIKLLIKNCRFKFDLLLFESPKTAYDDLKLDNVYALNHLQMDAASDLKERMVNELESSIKNVHPDVCLIIDSLNLLFLNLDIVRVNDLLNNLLSKYSKVIFLFSEDIVEFHDLEKIKEICSAYFELKRNRFANEIAVRYIYKKKCPKFGLDLLKDDYFFTFDQTTLVTKLVEGKKPSEDSQKTEECFSYDLSFNLTFNDEDKKKEQTVLPFMRAQNTQQTSKVYYVPDKSDDVDEEDPDDDLMI